MRFSHNSLQIFDDQECEGQRRLGHGAAGCRSGRRFGRGAEGRHDSTGSRRRRGTALVEVGDRHRYAAHLVAASTTCTYIELLPRELMDSGLRKDLCAVELPAVDGRIPLPTALGLSVRLNDDVFQRYHMQ